MIATTTTTTEDYKQIVALGIFLRAYIVICRDKLSSKAIYSVEKNYYFSQATIYGELHGDRYQEIFNNAALLISQSACIDNAFCIYAEEYMGSFSKKERQSKGKVYTPPEIVKWIHDKLEEQSPISLHKTYCDFAVGTGHFPFDWYDRLMKHWRGNRDQYPEIKDEHEAHRWIIERCLYFADIDPFAIRLCKMGLFLKDPEVAGLKFNSTVGDSLLCNFNQVFDYVAGNPPYGLFKKTLSNKQKDYASKETREQYKEGYKSYSYDGDISLLFVEMGLRHAHWLCFIMPRFWMMNTSLEPQRKLLKPFVHEIWDHGDTKQFDVETQTGCFLFSTTPSATIKYIKKDMPVVLDKQGLSDNRWADKDPLIEKILNIGTIYENIGKVIDGVYVGNKETFVLDASLAQDKKLQTDIRVLDVGSCITKWTYSYNDTILVHECTEEEYSKQKTPESQYLKENESILLQRKCKMPPYRYYTPREKGKWDGKRGILTRAKIYVKDFGFCLRDKEYVGLAGSIFLLCPHDSALIRPLLAILNSRLMEYYFRGQVDRRFNIYKTRIDTYRKIPIPVIDDEIKKQLESSVDKMLTNPNDIETQAEINKVVYKLYRLTEDETRVIEGAI